MKEKAMRKPRSKMNVLTKYWKGVALDSILWIYLALIVLCYNELGEDRPYRQYMDPLSLLFEIVSGYGTVGYSLGFKICHNATTSVPLPPGALNYSYYNNNSNSIVTPAFTGGLSESGVVCEGAPVSLAGAMRPVSKIIIMIAMLAGRHRGLPSHLYHKDMREGVKQQIKLDDLGV